MKATSYAEFVAEYHVVRKIFFAMNSEDGGSLFRFEEASPDEWLRMFADELRAAHNAGTLPMTTTTGAFSQQVMNHLEVLLDLRAAAREEGRSARYPYGLLHSSTSGNVA